MDLQPLLYPPGRAEGLQPSLRTEISGDDSSHSPSLTESPISAVQSGRRRAVKEALSCALFLEFSGTDPSFRTI